MPPSNTISAIQITNTTLLTHCTFVTVVTMSNVQKHLMILLCALYDCSQVFTQWNILLYWFSWNWQAKLLMNFILEWQKVLGQTWLRITPMAGKCTEGLWERRETYNCVRSRVAHNSQRGSDPCPLTKVWINKMWCVCMYTYICNRIFKSLKKEGQSDLCYNMDEHWRHYATWNKLVTKGQILYASTYMKQLKYAVLERQKAGGWLPGAGARGGLWIIVWWVQSFGFARWKDFWRLVAQQWEYT